MKSVARGKRFSGTAEVSMVTAEGLHIVLDGSERFMPFKKFPWFEHATISQIMNVEYESADHLRWPDIDVDLHVESIDHPERFPLIWQPERTRVQRPTAPKRARTKPRLRKSSAPRAKATRPRVQLSSSAARAR